MIIVSAGLQKSGTALYFNLTNDLICAAGGRDTRLLREEFNLHGLLSYPNCNIGNLTVASMKKLIAISEQGNDFTIKTHGQCSESIREYFNRGLFKITCIGRDPRDIVISAMDSGKKLRARGLSHTFASCVSVSDTIPKVKSWISTFMVWLEMNSIHLCRYEDLLASPSAEMQRLQGFLGLKNQVNLNAIWERYRAPDSSGKIPSRLHFNVGIAGRFRSILSKKEIAECNFHFGDFLNHMGYKE